MASQQNNFGVIHHLYADKKTFWDLSLGEVFTGLGLSLNQIKQGGGFVNASVRKQAKTSNDSRIEEHVDATTGKPYLRVLFALNMPKNNVCDLSVPEISAGLSLSATEIKAQGGFVKASVKQAHKSSRGTMVIGA